MAIPRWYATWWMRVYLVTSEWKALYVRTYIRKVGEWHFAAFKTLFKFDFMDQYHTSIEREELGKERGSIWVNMTKFAWFVQWLHPGRFFCFLKHEVHRCQVALVHPSMNAEASIPIFWRRSLQVTDWGVSVWDLDGEQVGKRWGRFLAWHNLTLTIPLRLSDDQ